VGSVVATRWTHKPLNLHPNTALKPGAQDIKAITPAGFRSHC